MGIYEGSPFIINGHIRRYSVYWKWTYMKVLRWYKWTYMKVFRLLKMDIYESTPFIINGHI